MNNLQNDNRITVKLKCPNPLFEEWLIMWRDQAAAKESKMQYSFNLALKSLKKYPLPFNSGRECKILKGFGDKLCKMLDDKLSEYKRSNGIKNRKNIDDNLLHINSANTCGKTDGGKRNIKKPVAESKKSKGEKDNGTKLSTKQYVPQFGSGGYAILVTLYRQTLQPNYAGFLKKADIISYGGKDLINSSFTKPDPGSRYTAWSSMKTLLTKNLVSKASHPPKFSLTEEGTILAKKLYDKSICDNDISASSSDRCDDKKMEANQNNIEISKSYDILIDPDEFKDDFYNNPFYPNNDTFSSNGIPTLGRNKPIIDDYNIENLPLSIKHKERQENIHIPTPQCLKKVYSSEDIITIDTIINKHSSIEPEKISIKQFGSSSLINSQKQPVEIGCLFEQKNKISIQKYSSTNTISLTDDVLPSSSKHSVKKYSSSSSIASTKSNVNNVKHFLMAPYSFDIILYVDNNETSGSSNSENDEILVGLRKFGIKFEVKNLKVGDFTWICRDRITNNELILPYVVERKRMDDFAKSIIDKRYHEQKFRLKKCGVENLTYLVESHGRNQHLGFPLQSLYQAATNTAIQENFFVKFTENIKETVEYLVNMTQTIIGMFKLKTLASCSKDDIQPVDINNDLIYLMIFKEFNESSIKNKRIKVTDLFVKMLIQIKGISVERALAITQKYPTPLLLKAAYEENPGKSSENLLSNIKYGNYGKSIGVVISRTVCQAFIKMQY